MNKVNETNRMNKVNINKKEQNTLLKTKTITKKNKKTDFLSLLFFLLSLSFVLYSTAANSDINFDLHWMLTVGRNILTDGFTTTDTLTMHSGMHSIAQQWLTDVIFFKVYDIFGYNGLELFTLILACLKFLLIFFIAKKTSNSTSKTALVCLFSMFLVCFTEIRPQMISTILLMLYLYVFESYFKGKNYLWALPIISIALVNVHAAFWPMMIIFALPYVFELFIGPCVVKLFENKKKFTEKVIQFKYMPCPKGPVVLSLFGVIIGGLINPYGLEALMYGFKSTNVSALSEFITEMKSPFNFDGIGFFNFSFGRQVIHIALLIFFVFSFIYVLFINKSKKINVRDFCLLVGTAFMGVLSYKYLLIYIIAYIFILLNTETKDFELFAKQGNKKRLVFSVICLVFSLLFSVLFLFSGEPRGLTRNEIDYIVETEAADNLENITVFCIDEGGYAEFKGLKPYMDSRSEVFLKTNNKQKDYFFEITDLMRDSAEPEEVEAFFETYDFDYIIVKNTSGKVILKYVKNSEEYALVERTVVNKDTNDIKREIFDGIEEKSEYESTEGLTIELYKKIV